MEVPEDSTLACAGTLHSLVEHLGTAAASAFVERFVRLWPTRQRRLLRAVEQCDADAGRDAALSLSSGASMVGAFRLAALGSQLHASVPTSPCPSAWLDMAGLMAELDTVGKASVADVERVARAIFPQGSAGGQETS